MFGFNKILKGWEGALGASYWNGLGLQGYVLLA